jgi:putative transposase
VFIEKASPQQDPYIERFNGTMRRDLLNVEEINTITEAQVLVNNFNLEYNEVRPHRSLHMMKPHAFSQSHKVGAP